MIVHIGFRGETVDVKIGEETLEQIVCSKYHHNVSKSGIADQRTADLKGREPPC